MYLVVCKQMTDDKFFLLLRNTWNRLTEYKKNRYVHLEMLSTKCVYKSYLFDIYI